MVLPTDEDAALPLDPSKETLDQPASRVAAKPSSILRWRPGSVGTVWRDHLDAIASQIFVQWIAVVSAITDQILWLGFDHVEIKAELHQTDLVMVRGVRADRER